MANKVKIQDQNGQQVFPITHVDAVIDNNGNSVKQILGAQTDLIQQAQLEVGAVPSDLTPTANSSNWVTSGGVYTALKNVNDKFLTEELSVQRLSVSVSSKQQQYQSTALGLKANTTYKVKITLGSTTTNSIGFYLRKVANSSRVQSHVCTVPTNTDEYTIEYETDEDNYQYLGWWSNEDVSNSFSIYFYETQELGTASLEEEINEKDKILQSASLLTTGLYVDVDGSGVVNTASAQRGMLYQVVEGDKLLIEDSDLAYWCRCGFFREYPYVGATAESPCWIKDINTKLTAPVSGYMLISIGNQNYPPITVYKLNSHANDIGRLDNSKKDRDEIRFINRLGFDASSLTSLTSATYANGVITLASGGSAKGTVNMFNDEVLIVAVIKPTSSTFNIQFGQYYADYGTLFGLRTDGNDSYLDLYAGTVLKASIELDFALTNGVEYTMMIKRLTLDRSYVYLDIISDNGQRYSLKQYNTSDVMLGRMWGALYCASLSGTCEVKNINVYSPYKSGCKVAVVGHSFVEGYSISGMRLQRFARLLQDVLGKEECGIFGQGGCKMADSLTLIQNYLPQYNPQYVLCCVGTNDNSMTLSAWKTWRNNIISACNAINATPVFFTIPPDQGAYEGEWNSINAFIRTCGSLYVDMDKCFVSNGYPVAARYLYDNCHPNPETHKAICMRIIQDLPMLVEEKDSTSEIQEEIDLMTLVPNYNVTNPQFVDINPLTTQNAALGSNGNWTYNSSYQYGKHKAIPVTPGDTYIISGESTNFWGWLTSSYNPPYANNAAIPYATGCDRVRGGSAIIREVPQDAAYLIVGVVNGSGEAGRWKIYKIDSYTGKDNGTLTKFRYAHWNIGRLKYYNYHETHQTSDISDADADSVALEFRRMINKTGANIIGICEYEPDYPRHSSTDKSKDTIFPSYKQARIGDYLGASSCNAVFMNSPKYVSMTSKVFEHTVKNDIDSSEAQRYYADVMCMISGKEVHVVETHLDWRDDATRALQIQELISTFSSYPYVIIGGDFNTDSGTVIAEMQPFVAAGYSVANGGDIGDYVTHEDNLKLDNIAVKGFAMTNIQVNEEAGGLSDHWILSCDLEMI